MPGHLPDGLIAYGPNANCTLELCPITASIYQYRPSLAANSTFIALFSTAMFLHIWRGLKFREWFFFIAVVLGCMAEILGYAGRLIMWNNPFNFTGFMIQICCITFAPVFMCAAIYVLLARITVFLDVSVSRVSPRFWYWFFLPCDIVSLVLQATGGAMSSSSSGSDNAGVDISMAGLCFQVATLTLFMFGSADYAFRYRKSAIRRPLGREFKVFLGFLAASVVFIYIRCCYRINELKNGYSGPEISNQKEFIGLEGAMIAVAAFTLLGANPGRVMGRQQVADREVQVEKAVDSDSSSALGVAR